MVEVKSSVWRALRKSETSVGVLVKTELPDDELTTVLESIVAEFESSSVEIDRASPLEIQETMKGPALVLSDVDPYDARAVLERLADRLTARGLGDAVLTAMPTVYPGGGPQVERCRLIKCGFFLRGQRPEGWTGRPTMGTPTWVVTPTDIDDSLTYLVEWALSLPGKSVRAAVSTGPHYTPVPLDGVLPMMRRAAHRPDTWVNCLVIWSRDSYMRWVDLDASSGYAAATTGSLDPEKFEWEPDVAQAEELLVGAGSWGSFGYLTRGHGTFPVSSSNVNNGDRYIGNPWASNMVTDAVALPSSGRLFDAYGVMRLRADLAAVLSLEPTWHTPSQPNNDVLVTHRDLAKWFGQDQIDPETLSAARAALNAHVIDHSNDTIRSVQE